MTRIVRLTESDLTKIVKRVVTEEKRKSKYVKPVNVLIEEIDLMLKFHYKTNSAFLKHAKDFGEKFNILESVKIDLVENIFSNDGLILEKFDRLANKKVITESEFNFQVELNGYFNFIRTSLLYQSGFINESQYQNYNLLNEEGFWSDLGSGISSGVQAVGNAVGGAVKSGVQAVKSGVKAVGSAVKSGAKAVVQGAKNVGGAVVDVAKKGYAALQGAWTKLKNLGLGAFMEKYRAFLTSNYGAALQLLIEVSTEGLGAVIPVIAWGLLLQYDIANVYAGEPNWFNVIFSIIGTATTGLASKAIGAAMPFFKTAGKAANSIGSALQWVAKSKFGQFFKPLVSKIAAGLGKIPGIITKAMTWVQSVFGKIFGQGVVNFFKKGAAAVSKFITEFATGMNKWFQTSVVKGSKKLVGKTIQKGLNTGASLSPQLATYLTTAAGKRLSAKLSVKTVQAVQAELGKKLYGVSTDQAIAYVDKAYGKPYGDMLRLAKTTGEIGAAGQSMRTSTQGWKVAAKNKTGAEAAQDHFKSIATNTKGVIQKASDPLGANKDKPAPGTAPAPGVKPVPVPGTVPAPGTALA